MELKDYIGDIFGRRGYMYVGDECSDGQEVSVSSRLGSRPRRLVISESWSSG